MLEGKPAMKGTLWRFSVKRGAATEFISLSVRYLTRENRPYSALYLYPACLIFVQAPSSTAH